MTLILHDLSGNQVLVNWASVFSAANSQFGATLIAADGESIMVTETIAQIAAVVGAVSVP